MRELQSKYILSRMKDNAKLLTRYRMAKSENEIDAKIAKKRKFKPFKRISKKLKFVNKIKSLVPEMAYPELRPKEYKKPPVDIYDEERNQRLIKEFFEAGEIKIIDESENENQVKEKGNSK